MRTLKKIVALSDSHGNLEQFAAIHRKKLKGDLFVHAGDFSKYSKQDGLHQFFKELQALPFRHKIVVAGNHEIALDQKMNLDHKKLLQARFPCLLSRQMIIQKMKSNCIYLEHGSIEIEGVKIFGTPYSQSFRQRGAFQYTHENQDNIFGSIPDDIDILITHHPPFQILDRALSGMQVGSKALRKRVMEIKPKIHIFGHVHESHGIITESETVFVNAATKYKQFTLECVV